MAANMYPKLITSGADDAIRFYVEALGASLLGRYTDETGRVVHAELSIFGHTFAVAETVREWGWEQPSADYPSPVLITLISDDPDGLGQRMAERGAEVVIAIEDRPYGRREGRLRDPWGHLWIVSTEVRGT